MGGMDETGKMLETRDPDSGDLAPPEIVRGGELAAKGVMVRGSWNLRGLAQVPREFRAGLRETGRREFVRPWDLTGLQALDTAGAYLLWQAWGERLPRHIRLRPEHESAFRRWQNHPLPSMRDAVDVKYFSMTFALTPTASKFCAPR